MASKELTSEKTVIRFIGITHAATLVVDLPILYIALRVRETFVSINFCKCHKASIGK